MHPREGWTEDRRAMVTRRGFLKQGVGAGLLLGGAGSLLEACSSPSSSGPLTSGGIPLPRPNNPVTWPLFKDNPAIKSGLPPEQGATLRIFNWVAYLSSSGRPGSAADGQILTERSVNTSYTYLLHRCGRKTF